MYKEELEMLRKQRSEISDKQVSLYHAQNELKAAKIAMIRLAMSVMDPDDFCECVSLNGRFTNWMRWQERKQK